MTKKQILFVNGHMNVGGIEKTLLDLISHLNPDIYDIDLLLLEETGDYSSYIPSYIQTRNIGVSSTYGPFFSTIGKLIRQQEWKLLSYRLITTLSRILSSKMLFLLCPILNLSKRYDYAIAYRPGICADIVAHTIQSKKKYVWWHHGDYCYSANETKDIAETWKHFNKIVTVSQGCKNMIQHYFPTLSHKITCMHNMIDKESIQRMAGEESPYQATTGIWKFVTVGRLCREKHIENVIETASVLIQQNAVKFQWYIIGDGELFHSLQESIKMNHLQNHVFLLGKKENPYPYIKFADLLVHTSYIEAQCTTVLEGMVLHTPCIMTRPKVSQDFTTHNINCILVEQNTDSLAKGITNAVNDKDLLSIIKENAYKTVSGYAPCQIVKDFANIINS